MTAAQGPHVAVTIPRSAVDKARENLRAWGGLSAAVIIGEDADEVGLNAYFLPGGSNFGSSLLREELDKRLRELGGRVGAKDEWVAADRNLGDLLAG